MNIALFDMDCLAQGYAAKKSPAKTESKNLDHSLSVFAKRIQAKEATINFQFKRVGKQAIVTYDIEKPREVIFKLYLLNFENGVWVIAQEYAYSKVIRNIQDAAC